MAGAWTGPRSQFGVAWTQAGPFGGTDAVSGAAPTSINFTNELIDRLREETGD